MNAGACDFPHPLTTDATEQDRSALIRRIRLIRSPSTASLLTTDLADATDQN
jgi:hypothetical protein